MADLRNQLRTVPVPAKPVRVKMGMMSRMWRLVKAGSFGFGLVAIATIGCVGRLMAKLLAEGKLQHVLTVGLIVIPLIGFAALLLWSEDKK